MPSYDICLVDDDAAQRRLIGAFLERMGFTWVGAEDAKSGLDLMLQHRPKVLLCDWFMPGASGIELLRQVRDNPDLAATYCVVITAADAPERRFEALEAGADDYLVKPIDPRELGARVKVGLRVWDMQARLRLAAITDGLTGLYNHDHLNRVIEAEWRRAHRYGAPLAVVILDIDYFKAVNDTFGHLVGNEAIQGVAQLLKNNVREVDIVGRFGGDEFVIVVPEAWLQDAAAVAERIRLGVCEQLQIEAIRDHVVTVSIGVAGSEDRRVRSAADLMALADRALYVAKRLGRNQVATSAEVGDDDAEAVDQIETVEVETLRRRVAQLSVHAKEVYVQSIGSLMQALEEKDPYTARHSVNVSYYAEQIARHLGCGEALVVSIRNAALLHDVGKVGIPDRILLKPSGLTPTEKIVMQQVPLISTRIIDHLRILESELQIIRHQREYFDGSGHPSGLAGQQIPLGSRVLLAADAFDAITTDRAYRPMSELDAALGEMKRCAGAQFDPRIVEALIELAAISRRTWQTRIEETTRSLRLPASPSLAAKGSPAMR